MLQDNEQRPPTAHPASSTHTRTNLAPSFGIVRAHDTGSLAVDNGGLECRQVGVFHVLICYNGCKGVAVGLLRVGSIVLDATGSQQKSVRFLVALEALYVCCAILSIESGVLARGLLAAAPPWVSEDVDIRTPESQPMVNLTVKLGW